MISAARLTVRLTQGGGLGDVILQSGAACALLAHPGGGIRIFSNNYCYQSVRTLFSRVPQVQACTAEHPGTHAKWPALVDLNDCRAIVRSLVGKPQDWYKQFGVPWSQRWDSCPIPELCARVKPAAESVIFVHDDPARNQIIRVAGYRPPLTPDIFDHMPILKAAREIHCMESAFFHLLESMPEVEAKLFFYPNARNSTYYPDLPMRHDWEIRLTPF
jgi:hypothetical protein